MIDLATIQAALREQQLDGWLLYDFRGINTLAHRVLNISPDAMASRRWFYFVPASGQPLKLVHRIETGALDHLPGVRTIYLKWQELEAGLVQLLRGAQKIAMEYSPRNANPYVSRVDAGTIELVREQGLEVVSSGDLIQTFEACWSDEQWALHQQADRLNQAAFEMSWQMIAEAVHAGKELRETDVQQAIMDYFSANGLTTYHPPIVGVNAHSGDPHYEPEAGQDSPIQQDDFVLIDLWSKVDTADGVYSDITKVGFVGTEVPARHAEVFQVVAAARDAGIAAVESAFQQGKPIYGWEVDDATRKVIEEAGFGDAFIHRTGHNIGRETHGNGAHIDNLETHEDRRLLPRTCFSIEPGVYLKEFGVRCEIDVFIGADGQVHVTGGRQTAVHPILA